MKGACLGDRGFVAVSMKAKLALGLLFCPLFWLLAPSTARAQESFTGRWRKAQGQALVLTTVGDMPGHFGGVELQVNASVLSFGVAAGVRYERVGRESKNTLHGTHAQTSLQWRPLQICPCNLYRYLDIHGDFGYAVGRLWGDGESHWRSGLFLGVGLDGGIPLWSTLRRERGRDGMYRQRGGIFQLVFSVGYRYFALNRPPASPDHELLLGLGIRGVL